MTTPSTYGSKDLSRFPIVLISAFVFVLTMLTFVNAVNADFVNWDDDAYVTENPLVKTLSPASIVKMFATTHFYAWIPLTLLSHAVDVSLWGMNPKGHHLTNVVLHSSNAVLLFFACLVLLRSLRNGHARTGFSSEAPSILVGSMVAALLFSMHPLRVESVAWVSGRKDLLCTFFLLPSLCTYLLWKLRSRLWMLVVSIVLFACALLAKPAAAPFPVVLLLLDVLLLQHAEKTVSIPRGLKHTIPYFLLSGLVGAVTVMAASDGTVNVVAELSALERILLPAYMFSFYLWRTVAPVSLSPVYPEFDSALFILSPIVVAGALACFPILVKRKRAGILLALMSYVLFLLPVFFGLPSGLQPIADRYSYIAEIGLFMLVAAALELLWRTSAMSGAKKYRRRMLFAALMVICAVSCYRTVRHVGVWNNSISLWTQAARYIPATREQYNERRPYMKPNYLDALINLGTAYYEAGNREKALEQFQRIVSLDDQYADAHYNIGNLLFEIGDVEASLASFHKAIASDSLYAKAYYNLGIISSNRGELQRAVTFMQQAARLGFVDAQRLLQQQGIRW